MEKITESYNFYVYDQTDPRVKGWFLMGSPLPFLLLIISYILFVKAIGPWWMKGRPAYNVEKLMLLYNTVQMIINGHFVYSSMTKVYLTGHYNIICQNIIYEPNPTEDIVVWEFYLFMWSRILDLLDTVFMVLKKNVHQLSFLHLYHHLLVAVGCWLIVKYLPGGNIIVFGSINSFVHIVMYFYYFLTAYDPSYKKNLSLKKRITQLQLVQFVIVVIQQTLAIFSKSCNYPKLLLVFFLSQMLVMLYLFSRFYHTAYIVKQKSKRS